MYMLHLKELTRGDRKQDALFPHKSQSVGKGDDNQDYSLSAVSITTRT